jgi:hypothetical protein
VACPSQKRIVFDNEHQVKVETQRTLRVKVFGKELADEKKKVWPTNLISVIPRYNMSSPINKMQV